MLSILVIMSEIKVLAISETQDLLNVAFQNLHKAKVGPYYMFTDMSKQTHQTVTQGHQIIV